MKKIIATLALVLGLSANSWAVPLMVDFERITSNSSINIASQLHLSIFNPTDALGSIYNQSISFDQVMFVFTNNVGISSSIQQIYIQNGPLSTLDIVLDDLSGSSGFSLANALNPGNLPGDNSFMVNSYLSIAAGNGGPEQGIDTFSDAVGLIYTLQGGLTAIQNALSDGSLRIGMHVQSIGTGGQSDGFVNTPPDTTPVPEPGTMMLLGAGFLGLAVYTKRRKNS